MAETENQSEPVTPGAQLPAIAPAPPSVPGAAEGPTGIVAPVPPRRSPGHRGADVKDTVAEMAAKAHEISLEAGSKMAAAMKDVINAAAGLTGFVIESARDLLQYMVRRGQMTQEEADKLIREVEVAMPKRPAAPAVVSSHAGAVHKPATGVPAASAAAPRHAAPPAKTQPSKPSAKVVARKPVAKKGPAPKAAAPKAAAVGKASKAKAPAAKSAAKSAGKKPVAKKTSGKSSAAKRPAPSKASGKKATTKAKRR